MIDLSKAQHHPIIEKMVDVLCNKTQNTDRSFFRVEAAWFLAKMAGTMRAKINTLDRGEIPVNLYTIALAISGYGKGYSVHILENEFMHQFKKRFMDQTFPMIASAHLKQLAKRNAIRNSTQEKDEEEAIFKEFRMQGAYPYTFDSATTPAVKQLRHKLLLADCGAINLQIDEIGSNLINSTEVLNLFLELFDQGMVKNKLVKSSQENQRFEEVDGKTPTNMLLFGTPNKLFDGSTVEDQFYSFLETGYARRCLFSLGTLAHQAYDTQSAEEIFQSLITEDNNETVEELAKHFHDLADPAAVGWTMDISEEVSIELLSYRIACEKAAREMADHEEIKKAEISHRYFKALKLAGALAFCDASPDVTMEHLYSAILVVEESGKAFEKILAREKTYAKLATYLAGLPKGEEVTHADLLEALPFYKAGVGARNELMTLATAWGYKKHILVKKTYVDGIEFFRADTLQKTDLDRMLVSYSDDFAYKYETVRVPFDALDRLTQANGMHWANHAFEGSYNDPPAGHRCEDKVLPGFNMIVLDIDEGVSMATAQELLKDYTYHMYPTKSSTPEHNRFRIILPINYELELDQVDFKEFMQNFLEWLPFKSDPSVTQRSKKWESYEDEAIFNEGELIDALPFIPKTSRNETYRAETKELKSLNNLERWFAQRMVEGNRNNEMIKFALALVDSGMSLSDVSQAVTNFNNSLKAPLDKQEIDSTIMTTVAKRYQSQPSSESA